MTLSHLIPIALLATSEALAPQLASAHEPSPPPTNWCEAHYSTLGGGSLGTQDLPWEITSPKGESYLPDIFYAEPLQNRQVMPTTLSLPSTDGKGEIPYEIDSLIYPTLGNPNLVDLDDPEDALMVVLRLSPDIVKTLGGHKRMQGTNLRIFDAPLTAPLSLTLIPRVARATGESLEPLGSAPVPGLHLLKPSCVMLRPTSSKMPPELAQRLTLQLVYDTQSLKDVTPGLYDLRLDQRPPEGRPPRRELAYNAVSLRGPGSPQGYTVVNVTDSQASVSENLDGVPGEVSFRTLSERRLAAFVQTLASGEDPSIKDAAFISFNGDLHNGGSPGTLLPETVANTYRREAEAIVTLLRDLPLPIFLTAGNHDGYASTGAVPKPIARFTSPRRLLGRLIARMKGMGKYLSALGRAWPLKRVIKRVATEVWWPGYDHQTYLNDYLPSIEEQPGGRHLDLFTGVFRRLDGPFLQKWEGWQRVPDDELNWMLYDGFNQWRRAYGPLYYSHSWGDSLFVSLNTFDLRQHRRTGWGMYTVNYGGGISPTQAAWVNKQLKRSQNRGKDIVLIAHHDPRGGQQGKSYPYYFQQVDYQGITGSIRDFIRGEVVSPVLCEAVKGFPEALIPASMVERCLYDGLQEWMRPDPTFDCEMVGRDPTTGRCDPALFTLDETSKRHATFSGLQLLDHLARAPKVRTLLLGHTHYNSVEILQPGAALVPGSLIFDVDSALEYINQPDISESELTLAELEVLNPLRRENAERPVDPASLVEKNRLDQVILDLAAAGHSFHRIREQEELVILRMTTVADLTTQLIDGAAMTGYATLGFEGESGGSQLERVSYQQWSPLTQRFSPLGEIRLDREATWGPSSFEERLERIRQEKRLQDNSQNQN